MFTTQHTYGYGSTAYGTTAGRNRQLTYGGYRNHVGCNVIVYDSVHEQLSEVKALVNDGGHNPGTTTRKGRVGEDYFRDILADTSFLGVPMPRGWDSVWELAGGTWQDGVTAVEEMAAELAKVKLPDPVTRVRRNAWSEEVGVEFNLDRCMTGQPYWRRPTVRPSGGIQSVMLAVQISALGHVSPRQMFWRATAAVAMAEILESRGYTADIIAYSNGVCGYRSGADAFQATWVKRAGEPLDVGSLVTVTAPWFRRTIGFAGYNLAPGDTASPGFGSTSLVADEVLEHVHPEAPNAWRVEDVYTKEAAVSLAQTLLSALAEAGVEAA